MAITFNTIRLQILTQRAEIEISKLIGATDAFIRRPFFYLGALQGLAGGALALAILGGSLAALNVSVAELEPQTDPQRVSQLLAATTEGVKYLDSNPGFALQAP